LLRLLGLKPGSPPSSQTNATEPYIAFDRSDVALSPSTAAAAPAWWTDQGNVLHGPTHITCGWVTAYFAGAASGADL